MPVFICKALTPQGQIVKSRVEDTSRLACIRKLKRNGLTPISVSQTISLNSSSKKNKKTRRNIKPEATFNKTRSAKTKNKNRKTQGRIVGNIKFRYRHRWKENNT